MDNEQLITTDMTAVVPVNHTFDHIVGNELRCSKHGNCPVITVKPTQVLEPDEKGALHLVDKVPM